MIASFWQRMWRRGAAVPVLILLVLAGLGASGAGASTYYVNASTGDDGQSCTNGVTFLTIQRGADCAVNPGDIVEIQSGTYYENVRPKGNGTSASPIIFRAAAGANVVVSGTIPLTGAWSLSGSSYRYSIDLDSIPAGRLQVFANGVAIEEARWPDDPYNDPISILTGSCVSLCYEVASDTSTTSITSTGLANAPTNWDQFGTYGNPMVWITAAGYPTHYNAHMSTVASYDSGTNVATISPAFSQQNAPSGTGQFFLYGTLPLLNQCHEWVYKSQFLYLDHDPTTTACGGPQTIEARSGAAAGFDLTGRSWVTVQRGSGTSFTLFAATVRFGNGADFSVGSHDLVDGLTIRYASHDMSPDSGSVTAGVTSDGTYGTDGIRMGGSYNTLQNSTVDTTTGNGVFMYGYANTVKNNVITNTGYDDKTHWGGIYSVGRSQTITQNTISKTNYSGIYVIYNRRSRVSYNNVFAGDLLNHDGGAIYVVWLDGDNLEIDHNYFHDSPGTDVFNDYPDAGIYTDTSSHNMIIHHNIVYGNRQDFFYGTPKEFELVYKNTFNGSATGFPVPPFDEFYGSKFIDNIFYGGATITSAFLPPTLDHNLISIDPGFFPGTFVLDCTSNPPPAAMDAGIAITGITGGSVGAPDDGAYECNGTGLSGYWEPGCRLPNTDSACTATYSATDVAVSSLPNRNLIKDSGFEGSYVGAEQTSNPIDPWYVYSGTADTYTNVFDVDGTNPGLHTPGSTSLRLYAGSEVRQNVPVLAATYTMAAWVKVNDTAAQTATVKVTAGAVTQSKTVDGSGWKPVGTGVSIASGSGVPHAGTYALKLTGTTSSAEQVITGLTPSTAYSFTAYGKLSTTSQAAAIGVKDYGSSDTSTAFTTTAYVQKTVNFTTGASNTTATIYFKKTVGSGSAWVDDFAFVGNDPPVPNSGFESGVIQGCWQTLTAPCWKRVQFTIAPTAATTSTVSLSVGGGGSQAYFDDLSLYTPTAGAAGSVPATFSLNALSGAQTLTPTLTWGWSSSSGSSTYQVLIDNNSNFSSPLFAGSVVAATSCSGTSCSFTVPSCVLGKSGTYYWKATAWNYTGKRDPTNSSLSFATGVYSFDCTSSATSNIPISQDGPFLTQALPTDTWSFQDVSIGQTDYTLMGYYVSALGGWTGREFDLDNSHPQIGQGWMYPGVNHDGVLVFTAPSAGTMTVHFNAGNVRMAATGGDGVVVTILCNEAVLWQQAIAGTDTSGYSDAGLSTCALSVGQTIRFIVNKGAGSSTTVNDGIWWDPRITY